MNFYRRSTLPRAIPRFAPVAELLLFCPKPHASPGIPNITDCRRLEPRERTFLLHPQQQCLCTVAAHPRGGKRPASDAPSDRAAYEKSCDKNRGRRPLVRRARVDLNPTVASMPIMHAGGRENTMSGKCKLPCDATRTRARTEFDSNPATPEKTPERCACTTRRGSEIFAAGFPILGPW